MKKTVFLRCGIIAAVVVVMFTLGSPVAFAQSGDSASSASVWHYAFAAFGLGLIVCGAAFGIAKAAAAAAEGISRQPSAAAQITGTVNLPIFLLEGVAIIAEVIILLIVFVK